MTRINSILAIIILLSSSNTFGRTIRDNNYRFNISLPDSSKVIIDTTCSPYLYSLSKDNIQTTVTIYRSNDDKVFSYGKIMKQMVANDEGYINLEPELSRLNLLRHRKSFMNKANNGTYICNLIEFRAKTLFLVTVSCEDTTLEKSKQIVKSFDSNCNFKSYFKIMLANLNWFVGTFFLTIIPLLGYCFSKLRERWMSSNKTDVLARRKLFFVLGLSILMIVAAFISLKDYIPIACFVCGFLSIVWFVFYKRFTFVINFFYGYFS